MKRPERGKCEPTTRIGPELGNKRRKEGLLKRVKHWNGNVHLS